MKLRDRTVVVTGASAGIGREACRSFARRGARVVAVARRADRLDELAGEVDGIVPVAADVTTAEGRERVLAEAGSVDVLVNGAGRGWFGLVEQMEEADVRALFDVNVLAPIALAHDVVPGMVERGRGAVVNVSSVAAYVSTPPLTVYAATKFALQGFSEGLRREVDGTGVTVATVNPGPVRTEFAAASGLPGPLAAAFNAGSIPPSFVAAAIIRAAEQGGRPGYREIAVPRALGFGRLAALPVLSRLFDLTGPSARVLAGPLGREERSSEAPGG